VERSFCQWRDRRIWHRLRHRVNFRQPDGERGAFLVLAAIATVLVVGAASLGVDLSKAVATKRKLQTVADLAALDAVQSLASPAKPYTAQQLAKASLVNNGYDAVDATPCNSYCVDVGMYPDPATGAFTVTADATKQNAVRVTLHSTRAWAIAPGSKTYTATGIAKVQSDAGIAIGSFLLRADTSQSVLDSVLGGMLGSAVSLDAVSYKGIASTQITLAELRSGLHVSAGTTDAFLNTSFKLGDVLTATASALTAEGNPTAAATLVDGHGGGLAATANSSLMVKLGDMITVAQGDSAALSAKINAFQLVQGSIQLANKNHFLTVSLPLLGVPGLATVSADITVIEAPQIAIGPAKQVSGAWVTKAKTAQINTTLHVNLLSLANVAVSLQAANGSAELRGISCATPPTVSHQNPVHTVTSALTAALSTTLLGIGLVNTNTSVAPATQDVDFSGFPADMSPGLAGQRFDWTNMKTVGAGAAGSTISANLEAGGLLGATINIALAPVFNLLDVLLDPLLGSLGITVGGADVWAWDLSCNARTLVN
jgi:uncharacterized membrane protein